MAWAIPNSQESVCTGSLPQACHLPNSKLSTATEVLLRWEGILRIMECLGSSSTNSHILNNRECLYMDPPWATTKSNSSNLTSNLPVNLICSLLRCQLLKNSVSSLVSNESRWCFSLHEGSGHLHSRCPPQQRELRELFKELRTRVS